jgi:predicted dithiol-disulfide oxidoreductase (DUF899 family)
VDGWHEHNVFFRDENSKIFRTYFINSRGDEAMASVWSYLDVTPLGRQDWEDLLEGYPKRNATKVVAPARRLRQRGCQVSQRGR